MAIVVPRVHRTTRRKMHHVVFIGIKAMWIVMIGIVVDARDLMNVSVGNWELPPDRTKFPVCNY